jgi:hypothetical protein
MRIHAPIAPIGVAPAVWHAALEAAYAKACAALPEAGGRLADAYTLVQRGAVEHVAQFGTLHYTVASQSDPTGLTTYDVHAKTPQSCTCEDFQRHSQDKDYVCKHVYAVWLYRRAVAQLVTDGRALPTVHEASCTPLDGANVQPAPLPEAAFSLCLKGRLAGQDAQLTIRGASYAEFARNVASVRALLDPVAPPGERPAETASADPTEAETPRCPYHGAMKESTKVKGTWFCPAKMGDGMSYCKEKWPQK